MSSARRVCGLDWGPPGLEIKGPGLSEIPKPRCLLTSHNLSGLASRPSGGWGPVGRTLLGPGPGGRPPEVTPPLKPTADVAGAALRLPNIPGELSRLGVLEEGAPGGDSSGFSQVASVFRGIAQDTWSLRYVLAAAFEDGAECRL